MHVYLCLLLFTIISLEKCKSARFLDDFEISQIRPKRLWNDTTLDKLRRDLFVNYDKHARPEEHFNVTNVRLGMNLLHIEANELKSTVTLCTWLRLVWKDGKLNWDPLKYGGVGDFRVASSEVWQPDLYIYNSVLGGEPIVKSDNPSVIVYSNGEILSVPPLSITALCELNLRYWPFDTQHCSFRMGSWTHNGHEISLELYNNEEKIDIDDYYSFSWIITNTTAQVLSKTYSCCSEPYQEIQFNLTMVRKYQAYEVGFVTPAVVLPMLLLAQFWLPPQSKEKLILNCLNIIVILTYLLYFTNFICAAGSNTPLIVIFYTATLFLNCIAVVVKKIFISLLNVCHGHTIPWIVKKHLNGKIRKLLFLDCGFIKESSSGNQKTKPYFTDQSEKYNEQEIILALAIDRFLFFLYLFIYLIVGIIYLC